MDLLTERVKTNFTAFGKPFGVNSLVMMTDTPRPISESSFEFGIADKWTWLGILASIMAVSFLLSIFKFYNNNSKKKFVMKKFPIVFLKYAWESVMIIFYEPFENVSKRVGPRIVCGTWILACVVIISEISAAMKSKYSFVEFVRPKSVDDVNPGFSWRLVAQKKEFEILRIMSGSEPKLKYVVEKIELLDYITTLDLTQLGTIFFSLKNEVYHFYRMGVEILPMAELYPLYISEPVTELHFVHPLSFEIAKDETFIQLLDFVILSGMETKWLDRIDAHTEFIIEMTKWRPPPPETNSISLKDLIPIFKIFLYGQLISTSTLLFEFLLSCFSGNLRLRI